MPYIGNTPAEKYAAFNVQNFTTSATTSYTLDRAVANELDIRLVINNVIQQPGVGKAYTAAGTTLTLSGATSGTDTMYAVYIGKAVQTVNPGAGSVGTTALADNAVTEAKLNVSNSPVNGYVLSAQSGATGGLTWAADAAGTITAFTNGVDNRLVTATSATALNGESTLTYDGTNLDLPDAKKIRLGNGNDCEFFHDGDNTYLFDNGTGDLRIKGSNVKIQSGTGEDFIDCNADGTVEVYNNNVKVMETHTGGISVVDGSVAAPAISNIGDTNTGLAFPYDNELHLIANGLDTLKIEGNKTTIVGTGFSGDAVTIQGKANQKSLIMQPENAQTGTNMMELGCNGGYDTTFRLSNSLTRNWDYMNDYSASNALYIMDRQGDNGVYIGQNNNSWSSMSDERIKHTWVNHENAEDKLNTLTKVGTYKRKLYDRKKPLDESITDNENVETKDKLYVGLSAQEVEAILPECISVDGNGIKGIKYQDLTSLLIKAVQELSAKVKALENA